MAGDVEGYGNDDGMIKIRVVLLRHVAHFAHSTFVSTLADEKRRVYISGGEKNWL